MVILLFEFDVPKDILILGEARVWFGQGKKHQYNKSKGADLVGHSFIFRSLGPKSLGFVMWQESWIYGE